MSYGSDDSDKEDFDGTMDSDTRPLTPKQFWSMAASWGSMMTNGDPGSCMYGFDERGVVQSEEHRQSCIDYINTECKKAAEANIQAGEDPEEQYGELNAMLAYLKNAPVDGNLPEFDYFTESYIKAALWSTNDESDDCGGKPINENYSVEHIDPETLSEMIADCKHFQEVYGHLLVEESYKKRSDFNILELAGHDFWLNRNGHGSGFWDGDWQDDVGTILSQASHSFGEVDLYISDGKIYSSGGVKNPASVIDTKIKP